VSTRLAPREVTPGTAAPGGGGRHRGAWSGGIDPHQTIGGIDPLLWFPILVIVIVFLLLLSLVFYSSYFGICLYYV
jgi:hypothetical protein